METESQPLMKKTSCAFTRHMPTRFSFKYDETHFACIELKKVLAEQIDFLYRQGITDFYTGCALGIDLWAGEAVLALMELYPEIKLHCVVPFAAQDQKWTPEQQARYHALLERSSDVFLTQEKYSEDCYYIRNRYLVDHADVVLAVYDMQANLIFLQLPFMKVGQQEMTTQRICRCNIQTFISLIYPFLQLSNTIIQN